MLFITNLLERRLLCINKRNLHLSLQSNSKKKNRLSAAARRNVFVDSQEKKNKSFNEKKSRNACEMRASPPFARVHEYKRKMLRARKAYFIFNTCACR
jgi:hypothetical protein